MMNEIKQRENIDAKTPESNSYKEIKPENGMTYSDSKQFWDTKFSNMSDGINENKMDLHHLIDNDVKQKMDVKEEAKEGGSYKEVKANSDGLTKEVHHMPADSVSPLDRMDGPAIKMDKEDHRLTASCGSSIEAREYQAAQREKIENGDFRGAVQMDIDDIKDKFGNKYDKAIEQMLQYVDKLEEEGRI